MNKIAQSGVPYEEMLDTLTRVLQSNKPTERNLQIENLRSRVQSPEISAKLGEILGALKIPDSLPGGGMIKDPSSGKSYPNTNHLIQSLKDEVQQMHNANKRDAMNTFNLYKFSQEQLQHEDKKKKKRGNPFRVLMGKIGKLLDHGLSRRDIIRTLTKEGMWDEPVIEKAFGIVKEYSRKRHKKQTVAQTLIAEAPEWPKIDIDYTKRSSAELITSICWLNSLDKITPENSRMGQKEAADKEGVKTKIRKIKAELLKRGMSEKDLDLIVH